MNPAAVDEWRKIQETVQKSVSASSYNAWIAPLVFDKIDLEVLRVSAPTRFIADWVRRNFFSLLLDCARQAFPGVKDVEISVAVKNAPVMATRFDRAKEEAKLLNLESGAAAPAPARYTFENFVEAPSNALAAASLRRLLENGAASFNPLLIHSPSGFGKTHLLSAFANEMAARSPEKRLIYISADKFMYSFIKAIKENDAVRFKGSFKSADVLVVDDIHFIAGKEASARELFSIIEDFVTGGRQVVLASNASPFAIEGLNESLKSRISHGLIVDILPADYNLRLEIARRRADALEIPLEPGVAEFVASKVSASIRELEGALNRLSAHQILMGEAPTLSNIRKILADILAFNSKAVSVADIKKAVAERWNVAVADLDSQKKPRSIVVPRQVAMYVAKSLTSKSLPEIGRIFGGRDHATVIYACKKVRGMMAADPRLENLVHEIEQSCSAA
jgi:chromosomal replication initiator protein